MSFIEHLEWRYATKEFDTEHPLSTEDLDAILKAIHLTPSSYGLQSYHVTVVQSKEQKERLYQYGFKQKQFATADTILVFSARTDMIKRRDVFLDDLKKNNAPDTAISRLRLIIRAVSTWYTLSFQKKAWAARQAYIALGFALAAAAERKVDSCAMEEFRPGAFKRILKLRGPVYPVVVLALGHRKPGASIHPKFRFPRNDIFDMQ